ncbi:MAG TPA: HD domain-containing phosphohydrolase [bacterium]|nr:HD domain-containing phosphohydrolase [bacterium]HNT64881.1 HD domain-containing phosphohydrolase [bacterium]HOX84951.1 HD domain-containing phosphohydrolase [bacterium]HPG44183.1 HD domain-containing phosphohydrolase [bacterium]HPM96550.1 HD domain-containing phosphohydrolase [bacterium]
MAKITAPNTADIKDYQLKLEQYRREHEKLQILLNITHNISRELDLSKLLMLIMDEVKTVLQCDRCTVFVLNRETGELWSRVAHGEKEIRFPSHLGIAGFVATSGEVLNIPDAYADERFNPNIDKKTGYVTRTILAVPMRNKLSEIIGVFQSLNKIGGPFCQDDIELLDAISSIAATQIENAQLYAEQKKTFDSFIETLATTIDARDPLTAGHSRRIALYADEIARVLNLGDSEREVLRTAALLHDYGKIAVREAILTKEGKLTDEEFKHIQHHPYYTRTILEKINFSRALKDVPMIAASHHEKLDGSGYPQGLIEREIPKLGKILAVVDVFDALTSKRHYRDRMNLTQVLGILSQGANTHFDDFFIAAFKKIPLSRLVEILEDDHQKDLDLNDLEELGKSDISALLSALESPSPDGHQLAMMKQFNHYYSRDYLQGKKNSKTASPIKFTGKEE